MTINAVENLTGQVSSKVLVDAITAVKIVDANPKRTKLTIELPCNFLNYCVIISESAAQADLLLGRSVRQDFSANNNLAYSEITFDTDSASQGEKWVLMEVPVGFQVSVTLKIVEFIG